MVLTLEEGLYPIGLSPRGIDGQACRKMHKNMFKSVISVKPVRAKWCDLAPRFDMPLISISQEGF